MAEGADPGRTALLCLFHDSQETRIGDVPSVGKGYVKTAPNPEVTADQVADFPEKVGRAIATWSTSTKPASPKTPSSLATPTNSNASCKPASTKLKASLTSLHGSRPLPQRCSQNLRSA